MRVRGSPNPNGAPGSSVCCSSSLLDLRFLRLLATPCHPPIKCNSFYRATGVESEDQGCALPPPPGDVPSVQWVGHACWQTPFAGGNGAPEGAGRRGAGGGTGRLPDDGGGSRIQLETEGGRRQDERQSRQGCWTKGTGVGRTRAERDAVSACLQRCVRVCLRVCLCVRLSPAQLRAESSLVGTGWEGVGLVPDSDLQLSGSRLFPSNSAWIPHTEPKCQFTALSPAPFP